MEKDPNTTITPEDGGDLPPHPLEAEPTYEQRAAERATSEQAFAEALQNGTLPEGVRDAQDYAEYLAEQKAKSAETADRDHALFSEIESIEDPLDRDLATALLGFSVIIREDGKDHGEIILGLLENYCKNGEEKSLPEFLKEEKTKSGLGDLYNGYDIFGDNSYSPSEKAFQYVGAFLLGNRLQKEMSQDTIADSLCDTETIRNLQRNNGRDVTDVLLGEKLDASSNRIENLAISRLIARDILSKYDISSETKLEPNDVEIMRVLSGSVSQDRGLLGHISDVLSDCQDRRDSSYYDERYLVDYLLSCNKVDQDMVEIKRQYNRYNYYLNEGQQILAEAKQ